MSGERILLVEDDPQLRLATGRYLQKYEYELAEAANVSSAEAEFRAHKPDLVLTDHQLPDGTSLDLLKRVRALDPYVPVIVLTGHGSIDLAVKAIKEGAEQFFTKPVDLPALLAMMQRLLDDRRQRQWARALQEREQQSAPDPFLGTSDAVKQLREQAQRVAEAEGPVLLLGETGSGKGVLTRWLHRHSKRAAHPFVDLNCAGLSRELLENELFGHEKGAFTGAQASKPGLLEAAHKGTLFLDEIGDIDVQVQPRLLKVLEDQRFRRLGDTRDRTVDLRLIAATHHDLEQSVRDKKFRSDLFFRISVLPLKLPRLRDRIEDLPLLARRMLPPGVELSKDAERALMSYSWPGNLRELRNVLERAQVLSRKPVIDAKDLGLAAALPAGNDDPGLISLEELERRHIERVLRHENGRVARAATVLGIAKSSLYQKIQKYQLDLEQMSSDGSDVPAP